MTGPQLDEASSCLDTAPARTLFYLDSDGSVCSPNMLRIGVELRYVALFSFAVLAYATAQLVMGPLGVVGVTLAGMVGMQRRWLVWQLRTAESHLAQKDYPAARECTKAVLGLPTAPTDMRACACQISGQIDWAEGQLNHAAAMFARSRELASDARDYEIRRELLHHSEIAVLINLGRVVEARQLVRWSCKDQSAGDYIKLQRQTTQLYLGFAIDHHNIEADDLHEYARQALGASPFPVYLLLCAWAFDKLGDRDMVALLLGASEDRWDEELTRSHPRLDTWRRAKRRQVDCLALTAGDEQRNTPLSLLAANDSAKNKEVDAA